MARGNTGLDSQEYDQWLSKNGKERELRSRTIEKRNANSGVKGWHFGLGGEPVHTKNIGEFKRELDKRGLMMRDDVKKNLKH